MLIAGISFLCVYICYVFEWQISYIFLRLWLKFLSEKNVKKIAQAWSLQLSNLFVIEVKPPIEQGEEKSYSD